MPPLQSLDSFVKIHYIGVIAVPISSRSMPVRGPGLCKLQSSEKAVYSRDDPCGRPGGVVVLSVVFYTEQLTTILP
jgi:hypothetical protein